MTTVRAECPALRDALCDLVDTGRLELPLLPAVAAEVISLSSDEDCDPRKLADVIRRDPAMSGHLLHMANSVAFRGRFQVISLHQAMSRLGTAHVRELAFVISCQSRVFKVRGHEKDVRRIFGHSLATALYAQEIARMRRANVEEAFLAGLLHDIGKPVLLQAAIDLSSRVQPFTDDDLWTAVDALHAYVGGELARSWGLPGRLADAIAHHHNPTASPVNAQGALITRLADDVAQHNDGDATVDLHLHPALPSLNLYPQDVDRLVAMREAVAARVAVIK